jgi:hypothetical protein
MSVGIATGYKLDGQFQFPVGERDFTLLHIVQTGSGAHPAGGSFPEGKRRGVKLTTPLNLVPRSRIPPPIRKSSRHSAKLSTGTNVLVLLPYKWTRLATNFLSSILSLREPFIAIQILSRCQIKPHQPWPKTSALPSLASHHRRIPNLIFLNIFHNETHGGGVTNNKGWRSRDRISSSPSNRSSLTTTKIWKDDYKVLVQANPTRACRVPAIYDCVV